MWLLCKVYLRVAVFEGDFATRLLYIEDVGVIVPYGPSRIPENVCAVIFSGAGMERDLSQGLYLYAGEFVGLVCGVFDHPAFQIQGLIATIGEDYEFIVEIVTVITFCIVVNFQNFQAGS